jgi:hypothetical protein
MVEFLLMAARLIAPNMTLSTAFDAVAAEDASDTLPSAAASIGLLLLFGRAAGSCVSSGQLEHGVALPIESPRGGPRTPRSVLKLHSGDGPVFNQPYSPLRPAFQAGINLRARLIVTSL